MHSPQFSILSLYIGVSLLDNDSSTTTYLKAWTVEQRNHGNWEKRGSVV